MYARSTTFKGRTEAVDDAIALVRDEVMPAVQEMDGSVGLSMLVDRATGTGIVTTAWESQQAMRGSAGRVAPLRERAQQLFTAAPEVREWEIGVLHRAHHTPEGACARVTWTRMPRERMDTNREMFADEVLPRLEQLPGFCSASLLLDRDTGRGALAIVYDSADALAGSRQAAAGIRTEVLQAMASELLDVAEFEVALAHLRVPETV